MPVGVLAALVLTVAVLAVLAAPPASARAAAVFSVRALPGAGPARFDRVLVERFGPASARTVLVLVPGSSQRGRRLRVRGPRSRPARPRAPGVGGRPARARLRGHVGDRARRPDQSLAYYLRGQPVDGHTFQATAGSRGRLHGQMGPRPAARRPAPGGRKARAGGRRVILGGHSLGASAAEAYASWDFAGRPGHRDLAGLVLIDGGLDGRIEPPTLAQARAQLQEFGPRRASIPSTSAPHGSTAPPRRSPASTRKAAAEPLAAGHRRTRAHRHPSHRSPPRTRPGSVGHGACSIPPEGRPPPTPGTRRPPATRAPGSTATSHRSHAWRAGSHRRRSTRRLVRPAPTAARHSGRRRTRADATHTAAAPALTHRRTIRLPLYAFQTSGSAPHVLRAARRLARISQRRLPNTRRRPHNDPLRPLTALPARNSFLANAHHVSEVATRRNVRADGLHQSPNDSISASRRVDRRRDFRPQTPRATRADAPLPCCDAAPSDQDRRRTDRRSSGAPRAPMRVRA